MALVESEFLHVIISLAILLFTAKIFAESCEFCATSCLREQDVKMLEKCIQIDRDCATVCYTASQLMSRDSEYTRQICNTCAEFCDACAEECEKHQRMKHCKLCAQACRNCHKMAR